MPGRSSAAGLPTEVVTRSGGGSGGLAHKCVTLYHVLLCPSISYMAIWHHLRNGFRARHEGPVTGALRSLHFAFARPCESWISVGATLATGRVMKSLLSGNDAQENSTSVRRPHAALLTLPTKSHRRLCCAGYCWKMLT